MYIHHRTMVNSKYEKARPYVLGAMSSVVASPFYTTCANRRRRKKEEKNFLIYTLASCRARNDLDQLNQHRQTRQEKSKVYEKKRERERERATLSN